jgi:hypothetical protein
MNTNKIIISGLVGGIAAFLIGFLIWGLALDSFMQAHNTAPAGAAREPMLMWAIIVGSLAYGLLYAVIYGRWANISTFRTGAIAGVLIGLLLAINYDFMSYAMMNMIDMTGLIVDILASGVYGALVGGVVGWMLGRGIEQA